MQANFKILKITPPETLITTIAKLQPLEVGYDDEGLVVMRTASTNYPEVLILSNASVDRCWTETLPKLKEVTLLATGEKITLEITGR